MTDEYKAAIEQTLVQALSEEKGRESPRIGIIGAASPTEPYSLSQGIKVGYEVRKFLENRAGTIFTGGVEGIGADAYLGIVKYCIDERIRTGKIFDDRFFVAIPNHAFPDSVTGGKKLTLFSPPHVYEALARLISKENVDIVRAGSNMYERRLNLASLADVLVVVNGGFGTDHEAHTALKLGKKVIALPYTGGTAELLSLVKEGAYKFPKQADRVFLKGKNANSPAAAFRNLMPLNFELVDPALIETVDSHEDIAGELEKVLSDQF